MTLLKQQSTIKLFLKNKSKQFQKISNNGDIKPFAVKHPKTASNLLKSIEQSNIISQKLKKSKKQTFLI